MPPNFFEEWFLEHGRDFPWREEGVSPFHLLVTEMLLRQTRAMQVARLWEAFVERYPDPHSLLRADTERLFEEIQELGFGNQRVEALQSAARHLIDRHGGEVPRNEEELLAVPHVGLYIAHALLCFACGKAVAVVDTNILRLFARFEGKEVAQPDIRRNPWAWEMARGLVPQKPQRAENHNYGLLDFTAQVCKPRSPQCERCPLAGECVYGKSRLSGEEVTPPW